MPNTSEATEDQPTGDPNYLVGLDLNGRRVVVIGAGREKQPDAAPMSTSSAAK